MGVGYRVLRSVARLAFAAQMRLEVSGAERLPPAGPVLFVSNHLGPTDQFAIAMRLPVCSCNPSAFAARAYSR